MQIQITMKIYEPWGKSDAEKKRRHPLTAHMLDVAACFHTIACTNSIRRAMERAAGQPITALTIARLSVLAFLHDVGKANSGHQVRHLSSDMQGIPPGWPHPAGHTNEALYIFSKNELAEVLPIESINEWGQECFNLWLAAISHHGRPVQEPPQSNVKHLWEPVIQGGKVVYEPRAALAEIGQCLIRWFEPAFNAGPPLPSSAEFTHLFAGLVQFADWLGSDTTFFPYAEPGEDRSQTAWEYAKEAVSRIGINVQTWRHAMPTMPEFSSVFGVTPHPIQSRMAHVGLGNLLILESETGSGKTEAALWRYAHLFQTGQVDSLYFALPTRVAATQIYKRTLDFAKNLWLRHHRALHWLQEPWLDTRVLTEMMSHKNCQISQFCGPTDQTIKGLTRAGQPSLANGFWPHRSQ